MRRFVTLSFLLVQLLLAPVTPLDFNAYEEGPCKQFTPTEDFDPAWFSTASLPYVGGGSKYHAYRMIFPIPNMNDITEDEYLNNICLKTYANTTTGVGELSAFGKDTIAKYQLHRTDKKGVIDFQSLDTTDTVVSRHTVTLTDHATFVFFATCWQDAHQKGFDIVSLTPSLDANTQKLIKYHAISLGFDPANFIFFPEDVCESK